MMLKNIDNVTNIQHILHLNPGSTGRLIQNVLDLIITER